MNKRRNHTRDGWRNYGWIAVPVAVKSVEDVAEVEERLIFFVMRKLTRYPNNNNGNLRGAMGEKFSPKRIFKYKDPSRRSVAEQMVGASATEKQQ